MLRTRNRGEWLWACALATLIVVVASVPYLLGWAVTPRGYRFTGLLINPLDGHSYLAKMGQGADGNWLFRLPYTAESHQPVMVYTYYLALGHLAPGGSPTTLVAVYHLARLVSGWGLLLALYYAAGLLVVEPSKRRWTLVLVGLTSGFGWVVGRGPDLTVPEAFTFASLLVNGHFALTILLMWVVLGGITLAPSGWGWWAAVAVGGAALASIQPLAVPVVAGAAGGWLLLEGIRRRARVGSRFWQADASSDVPPQPSPCWVAGLWRLGLLILVSAPQLCYDLWISHTQPFVNRWLAQNVTVAPPAWQWLLAYAPVLPLAAAGVWRIVRRSTVSDRLWLSWAAAQVALLMLPTPLQRRLSTGLQVPLVLLAGKGLWHVVLPLLRYRARRWVPAGLVALGIPGTLVLILAGISAVLGKNALVVLSDSQWNAMTWLRRNASPATVVLADEELGAVVPAWGGGARVVYGHPFETPDSEAVLREVDAFFRGVGSVEDRELFLERQAVDIVVVQRDRFPDPALPDLALVWEEKPVAIYAKVP